MRTLLLLAPVLCAALPGDERIFDHIRRFKETYELGVGMASSTCEVLECQKPNKKYELVSNAQPGVQWNDAGGYCGSWSIQRATMAKGAWISQQQVRNHTVVGGGHDEEILETNIDLALTNLKIKAEGFDYKNMPTPQVDSYRKWIKKQLAAGHTMVWMIMLALGHYPNPRYILPYGLYSHIEPVVGILSDHPLTDETVYDDDVVVHYTDGDTNTYYRTMASLPGTVSTTGWAVCPGTDYVGYPCINKERGFGWAIQGFLDDKNALPLSLTLDKWQSEPDTRSGAKPTQLTGTLTASGLTSGTKYAIYRWDSVEDAFNYAKPYSVHRFTATKDTEVYIDAKTFSSSGTTYYRCIEDSASVLV